jgi:hypothetical protein
MNTEKNMSTKNEPTTKLALLREQHQTIDDEADAMSARRFLSLADQLKLKELKVKRLHLRDMIDDLEKENVS